MIAKSDMIDGDAFERLAHKHGLFYATTHKLRHERQIDEIAALPAPVNVLSHNSDGGVCASGLALNWFDFDWDDAPDNIGHWFAQNCDVRDERLTPIPIGLETDRWHPPSVKKDAILSTSQASRNGLVYMNHTPRTFLRKFLYSRFTGESWCTVEWMDRSFTHYYQQLARHKFTFSPDGNGMDCCRTWEALYLGCYPIVQRHVFTEEFAKELPLLVVDAYDEITEEFLNAKYEEMSCRAWNWDALTVGYWDELIGSKLE